MRRRTRHVQRTDELSLDDDGNRRRLLQSVDAALASLRGRGTLSGSEATAMFELLGDALPDPAAAPNALVVSGRGAFRDATVVRAAVVADHLLDVRLAAMAEARDAAEPSLVP